MHATAHLTCAMGTFAVKRTHQFLYMRVNRLSKKQRNGCLFCVCRDGGKHTSDAYVKASARNLTLVHRLFIRPHTASV